MFQGMVYNSIDEKNRVIIPQKFRSSLGDRCVVTKGLDRCLYIYTADRWEAQMKKLEMLPESDPGVRKFIRHFCANAEECVLDKQGRVLLTQELKKYAGISKELVTMGAMSKIEIWAREVWEAPDNSEMMDSADFEEALAKYNF